MQNEIMHQNDNCIRKFCIFFLLRQNSIRIFIIIKMKKFKKSLFFIFSYFWEDWDILYWTIDYRRDVYVVESIQL